MHFTGVELASIYNNLMARMESLKPGDKDLLDILEQLKEVHGTRYIQN